MTKTTSAINIENAGISYNAHQTDNEKTESAGGETQDIKEKKIPGNERLCMQASTRLEQVLRQGPIASSHTHL